MIVFWPVDKTIARVNEAHAALAKMWPRVKALAPSLSADDKVAWNALVYVQDGVELQLVYQLRDRYGDAVKLEKVEEDLGMFAGLPAPSTVVDVPRLTLEALSIAPVAMALSPLAVGKWVLLVSTALLALLGVAKVTGAMDAMERHFTATAKYQAYLDEMEKRGLVPPPPSEPKPGMPWLTLGALGLLAGGVWLYGRRSA